MDTRFVLELDSRAFENHVASMTTEQRQGLLQRLQGDFQNNQRAQQNNGLLLEKIEILHRRLNQAPAHAPVEMKQEAILEQSQADSVQQQAESLMQIITNYLNTAQEVELQSAGLERSIQGLVKQGLGSQLAVNLLCNLAEKQIHHRRKDLAISVIQYGLTLSPDHAHLAQLHKQLTTSPVSPDKKTRLLHLANEIISASTPTKLFNTKAAHEKIQSNLRSVKEKVQHFLQNPENLEGLENNTIINAFLIPLITDLKRFRLLSDALEVAQWGLKLSPSDSNLLSEYEKLAPDLQEPSMQEVKEESSMETKDDSPAKKQSSRRLF